MRMWLWRQTADPAAREFSAFIVLAFLAMAVPAAALLGSAVGAMWLWFLGHRAHPVWTWLNSYDKHGVPTGPSHGVGAYYFVLLNLYLLYQLCELLAAGFRQLRKAMA